MAHTISSYRRFPSRLHRPGRGILAIAIGGQRPAGRSLWIPVRWRGGRLRAPIFEETTGSFRRIGAARVTRPNRRSVTILVRPALLDDLRYGWSAFSDTSRARQDRAPDRGPFVHRMR